MKKSEFIAKLEVVKDHSPVVSIDFVLAGLGMLEDEVPKATTLSSEMIEELSKRIERCLDHNSEDLVDKENITFNINYGNVIEVEDAYINVYEVMEHITAVLEEYENDDELNDSVTIEKGLDLDNERFFVKD